MQNVKTKNINILDERLLDFAARIVKLALALPNNFIGRHIAGQIIRSGTSPGSNYEEACGAESRSDFIHKLDLVLKELKEIRFWLRLIKKTDLIKVANVESLLSECNQLSAIIAKSIITSRKN